MTNLVPYLTVHDATAAIAFYAAAFGAQENTQESERDETDGKIGFVALTIGNDPFYLSDEFHDYGAYAPATLGHSTSALVLGVDDADAVYAAALAAGATADREPSDQGDEKRGWLVDPFGHRWAIHSPQR